MAKSVEQVRGTDLTAWGITALVAWAVAILAANLSGLVPAGAIAALHAPRTEGATVNQLVGMLDQLETETTRLKAQNSELAQRLTLSDQDAGDVQRRVATLEKSMPLMVEQQATLQQKLKAKAVDDTTTGGIGDGQVLTFETEGGTVAVQQRPMPGLADPVFIAQPVPPQVRVTAPWIRETRR